MNDTWALTTFWTVIVGRGLAGQGRSRVENWDKYNRTAILYRCMYTLYILILEREEGRERRETMIQRHINRLPPTHGPTRGATF